MGSLGSREVMAGVGAAASLGLGILVVAMVRMRMGVDDGVTVAALLLVPLVVYGLISGRFMELTGPGGLGVKFKETAAESLATFDVSGGNSLRLSPRDMMRLAKGTPREMEQNIVRSIPRGGPRALTMRVREGNNYNAGDVTYALQKLEHSSNTEALERMERLNLEAIAVVDKDHRFRGVIERDGIVSQMMLALAKGTKSRG